MQKNIVLGVFTIIILGLAAYIIFFGGSMNSISQDDARTRVEKFVNENLMQPGTTVSVKEVVKEHGMYKMVLTLPDNSSVDTYLTTDGELFIPSLDAIMNIDEITAQIAANQPNNTQMQVQTEIITPGDGEQVVQSGDSITVDYTGTLEDGTQFDSSIGKQPFTFTIGQGSVIEGWDQGLLGMKVGEERKLTIPSDLAYGPAGNDVIPPDATLIFTVKLISINQ